MIDTPITDAHQSACLKTGGRSCKDGKNAYWLARNFEKQISIAVTAITSNIESNKQAAINSPQNSDWSNGVAKGLEIALNFLQNNQP